MKLSKLGSPLYNAERAEKRQSRHGLVALGRMPQKSSQTVNLVLGDHEPMPQRAGSGPEAANRPPSKATIAIMPFPAPRAKGRRCGGGQEPLGRISTERPDGEL